MPESCRRAVLSLGGNVDDVTGAFRFALAQLAAHAGIQIDAISDVWRTPPWGLTDQPDFLNVAFAVSTSLDARQLLGLCLHIEAQRGRVRDRRWGPRVLDIDIVTFGDETRDEAGLVLPHPRAHERAFVLRTIADFAPDLRIRQATVADLLRGLDQTGMARDRAATEVLHQDFRALRRSFDSGADALAP